MRKVRFDPVIGLVSLLSLSGCAGVPHQAFSPAPGQCPRGVIFTADGAGSFGATTEAFRQAVSQERLPLSVERFKWSHGIGRVISDQVGFDHAREAGGKLAQQVIAYRQAYPDRMVFLAGHSAGSEVVLSAAEQLPPESIERIVLLSPSVSSAYDIRPALRSTRQGIDVYCSRRDWFYLGLGTTIVGTADRRWIAPAGRVGFRVPNETAEDAALYSKLKQHSWDLAVAWTGNWGGHYGAHRPAYLRAYVLPLFSCGAPPSVN